MAMMLKPEEIRRCPNEWCRRPLPARHGSGECSTCRAHRRAVQPNYRGLCILDGCGPARRRSGIAGLCYRRLVHRARHLRAILRDYVGVDWPVDHLLVTMELPAGHEEGDRARAAAWLLIQALAEGRLAIYRVKQRRRRPRSPIASPENRA